MFIYGVSDRSHVKLENIFCNPPDSMANVYQSDHVLEKKTKKHHICLNDAADIQSKRCAGKEN